MPAMLRVHDEDPEEVINRNAGDLRDIFVTNNQILVGVYDRSEGGKKEIVTEKGLIIPIQNTEEDKYQSKVGLILRMGPSAFIPPKGSNWFMDQDIGIGDWVVFRASDGWSLTLVSKDPDTGEERKLLCRMVDDTNIRAKIESPLGPDRVY